jgi:hypothetical protein
VVCGTLRNGRGRAYETPPSPEHLRARRALTTGPVPPRTAGASGGGVVEGDSRAEGGHQPFRTQLKDTPTVPRGKLLGVPTRAQARWDRGSCPLFDLAATDQGAARLRRLFQLPQLSSSGPARLLVSFPALVHGTKLTTLLKKLYPAPVVQLLTGAAGRRLCKHTRQLLGLPVDFPAPATFWLFRLWFSQLSVRRHRLKLLWRCTHKLWVGREGLTATVREVQGARSHRPKHESVLVLRPFRSFLEVLQRSDTQWPDLLKPDGEAPYTAL